MGHHCSVTFPPPFPSSRFSSSHSLSLPPSRKPKNDLCSQRANDSSVLGIMFALVAGMMVYICVKELLPTSREYDPEDRYSTASCMVGMGIMALSLVIFSYV